MTAKQNRKELAKLAAVGKTIWLADNHAWEITRNEHGYMLTDWRPGRTSRSSSYYITHGMHDDRALWLARNYHDTPVYVVEAMRAHCT